VRGFGLSITSGSCNTLTPTLSPNGERESHRACCSSVRQFDRNAPLGTDVMLRCLPPFSILVAICISFCAVAADAPPGALSCSGCHPARKWVDTQVPRLAGRDLGAIVQPMRQFKTGQLDGTVMVRIAKGFSDDEISAIAAWYAAQKE
jgi:cytochrome subunit of sulfide dehydrogenase